MNAYQRHKARRKMAYSYIKADLFSVSVSGKRTGESLLTYQTDFMKLMKTLAISKSVLIVNRGYGKAY